MNQSLRTSNTEQLHVQIDRELQRLIETTPVNSRPEACFATIRLLLAALGLNTGDFASASTRLDNAQTYLASGERGAALFELRLVQRSLWRSEPGNAPTT